MILTDNETRVDLLNNEAIAKTVVSLLKDRQDHPLTIGIHGDWGSGKSSLLEMIDARLSSDKDVLCLKFNGWRFQGFEDAKIALIEGIVTGLLEKRPELRQATAAVKKVFDRIDWLKVAKKAGGLALTAFTGIPSPDQLHAILGGLRGLIEDPSKIASRENLEAAIEGVQGLLKPQDDSKNVPEEIAEFRKAFDNLLKDAGIKQLIVLIDDLDRCLPDTAIETLEAVRLFVFTSRTAFVVAADEAMIEYSVKRHFPDLPESSGPRDYARNYLEKLIQVPFRIPALGVAETGLYVTLLLVGARLGENDEHFKALIEVARNRLRRPWETTAIEDLVIKQTLDAKHTKVKADLDIADQISPALAAGTYGNPRQIKRFLNSLLLRKKVADERGFGDAVKLPILAKLMLAERFDPRLFDQIAASVAAGSGGLSADLTTLEASLDGDPISIDVSQAGSDAEDDAQGRGKPVSYPISEWLASPSIRAWAQIRPRLAGVDLRPYLFATKDRKDVLAPLTMLGQLQPLVEKLLGKKLALLPLEGDVKKLTAMQAGAVFEALRGRVIAASSLLTEPEGMAGLAFVVKNQPQLQSQLVSFLESLPADRVGAWVVRGWEGILREPEFLARFERLIAGWAANAKNPGLKAAAKTVQKIPVRQ
jgi:hypothetical protein